ncbi:MAG: hypothetical protein ACI95C_000814 [Pseudohongiellaceae bacterium]|jgi:hypothetical protein
MNGEMDLEKLLASLQPKLLDENFVFCSTLDMPIESVMALMPVATYREQGGMSLILTESAARSAGFEVSALFRCITLTVHSSLDAVGLTAAVADKLASNNISANMVAAYYHDHVYVPAAKAEQALELLSEFQKS